MLTAAQIASNMVTQLRLLDPSVSAEIGTPERKIIEAVAEMIAGSQVDFSVLLQQHDLDAMTGGRLDAYLGNFGFGRQQPRPAVGVVTFSRSSPALAPITIPRGTQILGTVDNSAFPDITFLTTETVVLSADSTSVDAPVRATTAGTIGNLPAGSLNNFASLKGISGITSVTNTQGTSQGLDGETDAEYKLRFKNTLFRNMAGTYDQILALAVSSASVTKANVVGPVSRYQEYIQVPGRATAPTIDTWTVSVPGTATTFTITINSTFTLDGALSFTTANIAQGATADQVMLALQSANGNIIGDVNVTRAGGAAPYVYTITFVGALAGQAPVVTSAVTGGSGSNTVTHTVTGAAMADNDDLQRTEAGSYDDNAGTIGDPQSFANMRTTALSTIPYSKYAYLDNAFLTDGTLDPGTASFYRLGVDWMYNPQAANGYGGSVYANATAYAVGDIVRGNGASGGGRLFMVTTAGTSNTATPTWVTTTQYVSTTSAGAVFTYIGLTTGNPFLASTAYSLGQTVQAGGNIFVCTTAGTTAAAAPAWVTTTPGVSTTTSNTATFTYLGPVRRSDLRLLTTVQPNVTILGRRDALGGPIWPAGLEPGSIALFEHQYMSKNSRNNYALGVMNCIDVFVNGGDPVVVNSVEVMPGALIASSHTLQNSTPGKWTYQKTTAPKVINFRRALDGREARAGNVVTPLYWQPVLAVPSEIVVGQDKFRRANYYGTNTVVGSDDVGTPKYWVDRVGSGTPADPYVYSNTAHYCHVIEVNGHYGTVRARDGIEWFTTGQTGNALPPGIRTDGAGTETYSGLSFDKLEGQQFTVAGYTYDQNIRVLQSLQEAQKQVTSDILVHRAYRRYFKCYLTIMYTPGATKALVDASIWAALAAFYENQYYGSAIQLSDILQTVHNVPGVDNVRWTADQLYPSAAVRANSTAYARGTVIRPATPNGFVYRVTTAGTTGGSPPTYPTVDGVPVTDGTAVLTAVTEVRVEEVSADGTSLSSGAVYFTNDFFIEDRELASAPADNVALITRRAQNTWVL